MPLDRGHVTPDSEPLLMQVASQALPSETRVWLDEYERAISGQHTRQSAPGASGGASVDDPEAAAEATVPQAVWTEVD